MLHKIGKLQDGADLTAIKLGVNSEVDKNKFAKYAAIRDVFVSTALEKVAEFAGDTLEQAEFDKIASLTCEEIPAMEVHVMDKKKFAGLVYATLGRVLEYTDKNGDN